MVRFFQDTFTGSETSGFVTVILQLIGGTSTGDIIVTVILSDITAEGKIRCPSLISSFINIECKGNGRDYDSTPINVTIAAGSLGAMVNISVTNDSILEESETFNLAFIIPSSLSGRVIPGDITTATGIITDDTGNMNCNIVA